MNLEEALGIVKLVDLFTNTIYLILWHHHLSSKDDNAVK